MTKTFKEVYGEEGKGSNHLVCPDCGLCLDCKDCDKFGCGELNVND